MRQRHAPSLQLSHSSPVPGANASGTWLRIRRVPRWTASLPRGGGSGPPRIGVLGSSGVGVGADPALSRSAAPRAVKAGRRYRLGVFRDFPITGALLVGGIAAVGLAGWTMTQGATLGTTLLPLALGAALIVSGVQRLRNKPPPTP